MKQIVAKTARLIGTQRRCPRDWQVAFQELVRERINALRIREEGLILKREVLEGVTLVEIRHFIGDAIGR